MTDKNITHIEYDGTLDAGKSGIKKTGNRALVHRPHGSADILESLLKDGDATVSTLEVDGDAQSGVNTGDQDLSAVGNATSIRDAFVSKDVPLFDAIKIWFLKLIYYLNSILWSEDISQAAWTGVRSAANGTDGMIATSVSGSHLFLQNQVFEDGTYVMRVVAQKGTSDYFAMYSSGGADGFLTNFFDLNTGVIVTQLSDAVKITDLGDGWFELLIQDVIVAGAKTPYLVLTPDGVTTSFIGDDVSVMTRAKEISIYKGTIADNFPYLKTTTVAVSAPAFVFEENTAGTLEKADGTGRIAVVPNVLFDAPEPYQTQGGADKVYAQLISGTGYAGSATETINGGGTVNRSIGTLGGCYDFTNTQWLNDGYYISSSFFVSSKIVATELSVDRGASMDDPVDDVHMWFYFTLK